MKHSRKITLIITFLAVTFGVYAEEKGVDYLSCFYFYMNNKIDDLNNDVVVKYIKDYKKDVYKNYKDDEFDWQNKIVEIKNSILVKVNQVVSSDQYFITANVNFGNYDFEKKGFPVEITDSTYFPLYSKEKYYSSMPTIRLVFKDFVDYSFFSLSPDEGNKLVKSLKSSGRDRILTFIIHFKFVNFDSDDYRKYSSEFAEEGELITLAEIINIEVYNRSIKVGEIKK